MAVPSRGVSPSMAARTAARSVVGATSVTGRVAKATRPTRTLAGKPSTKSWAAERAASSRVGATSSAFIEPEMSMARMTVASSRGVGTIIVGRARPMANADTARR